jgi:hydroxyacylglutathione hydrolase
LGGLGRLEVKILDGTPEPFQRMISPYLVVCGDTAEAVMIDSGSRTSAHLLADQVRSEGVRLKYIILTHIHLDHGGGAGSLYRLLQGVERVYVHPRGARHLVSPEKLWEASKAFLGPYADYYGKPEPLPEAVVAAPGDGEEIEFCGSRLRVIHTPGHASHHMSILSEDLGVLFTGDSAGVSVVDEDGSTRVFVPTNPPPFKPAMYYESLLKMIREARGRVERVALGHYGYAPGGFEYLERHAREVIDWFRAAYEAVRAGASDPGALAEELARRLEQAKLGYGARSPIIREFFYMGAVMGLLDAAKRGEPLPVAVG